MWDNPCFSCWCSLNEQHRQLKTDPKRDTSPVSNLLLLVCKSHSHPHGRIHAGQQQHTYLQRAILGSQSQTGETTSVAHYQNYWGSQRGTSQPDCNKATQDTLNPENQWSITHIPTTMSSEMEYFCCITKLKIQWWFLWLSKTWSGTAQVFRHHNIYWEN